jgi:hypothetical protein
MLVTSNGVDSTANGASSIGEFCLLESCASTFGVSSGVLVT